MPGLLSPDNFGCVPMPGEGHLFRRGKKDFYHRIHPSELISKVVHFKEGMNKCIHAPIHYPKGCFMPCFARFVGLANTATLRQNLLGTPLAYFVSGLPQGKT